MYLLGFLNIGLNVPLKQGYGTYGGAEACSNHVGRHKNRKSEAKDNPRHISRQIGKR